MKILIGLDESTYSKAALEFVRKMLWPKDTRVVVISVVQPVVPVATEMYVPASLPLDVHGEMVRVHQEIVAAATTGLQTSGLAVEAQVLQGDPRIALVEAARTERADLLVVGSHGRTGIARLLMGSVAQHVVAHAPCSVLVVKREH